MKVLNKPIEVISIFDPSGAIRPIKIRMEDENQERKVFKVETLLKVDKEKIAGKNIYKFTCISMINSREKIYKIWYHLDETKWTLYKM